jgi:hypothetical protein
MSGGNGAKVKNILNSAGSNVRIYCNTAASGAAANYTMTFNGTIKVKETVK